MLQLIINAIVYLRQVVYYVLLLSYGTGRAIVCGLAYAFETLARVLHSLKTLMTVMSEDFQVFFNDVAAGIRSLISGLLVAFETIGDSVSFVVEGGAATVSGTAAGIAAIWNGTGKLLMSVGMVFVKLKGLLVMFGSGAWFVIESIPLVVSFPVLVIRILIQEVFELFRSGFISFTLGMKATMAFIFDMPLEALAGLLATGCIIYVLLKFHILLYRAVGRLLTSLARSLTTNFRRALLYCVRFKPRQTRAIQRHKTDGCSAFDNSCVVCQEREKCVLILPCKHLCLCDECCGTLRSYNRRCPVCRTYAQKTMKVYT